MVEGAKLLSSTFACEPQASNCTESGKGAAGRRRCSGPLPHRRQCVSSALASVCRPSMRPAPVHACAAPCAVMHHVLQRKGASQKLLTEKPCPSPTSDCKHAVVEPVSACLRAVPSANPHRHNAGSAAHRPADTDLHLCLAVHAAANWLLCDAQTTAGSRSVSPDARGRQTNGMLSGLQATDSPFCLLAGESDDIVTRVPGAACNDVLGIDRVALLFLTIKGMYHEAVWRRWLGDAAGLLPVQGLQARTLWHRQQGRG